MKALVISGGSNKGAYLAGNIFYLLKDLNINYEIYCGISVGAINAAYISQYKDNKTAADNLKSLWLSINTKNIYKKWKPFGFLSSLYKMSIYDSSPLQDLLFKSIDLKKIRASGKIVSVGCISINSGKYYTFTQKDDDFVSAVVASAAFPAVLTPVRIDNELFFDGGAKQFSPIKAAIDLGATEIDLIMTSPEKRNSFYIEKPNIFDLFKRAIDLSSEKIMSNDLEKVEMHNKLSEAGVSDKKVIKMNVLQPYNNLTKNFMDFNPKHLKEMFDLGYERARDPNNWKKW